MRKLFVHGRTLGVVAVLLPLLALFIYVALRSGPLAPIPVTVVTVEARALTPGLFGIGTVESRYTYKIGPIAAGRLKGLDVQVGDEVNAGQLLGAMDPVDLDQRIQAQEASSHRAQALLNEASERHNFAQTQLKRYEQLLTVRSTSEENVANKKHELQLAEAGLQAAREELVRVRADRLALIAQRDTLNLNAPVAGRVTVRAVDPGTTLVAGQTVVELIDPSSLWVNVRFDQIHAHGLVADLPAAIALRSQSGKTIAGRVLRVEPLADAVTEETLAKVVFDQLPRPLPPIGELAEVTVTLPKLAAVTVIPNAAIQQKKGKPGVWQVKQGNLHFTPVTLGITDLDGHTQVLNGLNPGDQVVVYSANSLSTRSRIQIVDRIPGVTQ